MANSKKINDVYKTKSEYFKASRKLLKKFGFKDGIPFTQLIPAHFVTNLVKDSDSGIRAWMTDIENRRYTVIAYPINTSQGKLRKKISEIDSFYKFFAYVPKNVGRTGNLKLKQMPYGSASGIKDFVQKRDSWIRQAYKQLRAEGVKGSVIYKRIRNKLIKEKPSLGTWQPRKRSPEEAQLKRNLYELKESTIKYIIFKK